MSMDKVCGGLCRAHGTGQCAPLCLTQSSNFTRRGECPLRTHIWLRQGTEIAFALDHGDWIDPLVPVKETGIVVTLSLRELSSRAVTNPMTSELITPELIMAAAAPEAMFKVSGAQFAMMKAKAQRLLGKG